MEQYEIDPGKSLKVIASAVYFPIDCENSEDAMALKSSVDYTKANFGEEIDAFRVGDRTVVIEIWNSIMFSIDANNRLSEELLRAILQNVRDIAVFLFGPNIASVMASRSISATLQEIFSKYVNVFFELGNRDFKAYMGIPEAHDDVSALVKEISAKFSYVETPADSNFVECILFKNHKIVGRFWNSKDKGVKLLTAGDVFRISLLERMEYASANMQEDGAIEMPQVSWVKHKKVHFAFDDVPKQCYLSQVRLGENSPYVLIFAANGSETQPNTGELITNMAKQFARLLSECHPVEPERPCFQISGLLVYLLVNTTTGEYKESAQLPPPQTPEDTAQALLFAKLRRRMISLAVKSVQSGLVASVVNEMIFQYTCDLKFVGKKGASLLTPSKKVKSKVAQIKNVSYAALTRALFPEQSDTVTCYVLMTVYLGVINTKDVIDANSHLFDMLLSRPHTK